MALANFKGVVDAELEGRVRITSYRKLPNFTAGLWSDCAIAPGLPLPKYWFDAPPGVAQVASQSDDGGFYHGPNVSPQKKYLRQMTIRTDGANNAPSFYHICDYLLYYPSIDEGTTDEQFLDNTNTLTRYTDGKGVMILPVSVAARTGGQQFYVTYTNSDGVSGRVSQTVIQNTATNAGNIVTSARATNLSGNPFIGLAHGDTGVRSIESVTMLGADVGLFSLILVKPLAQIALQEVNSFREKDFLLHDMALPVIEDDAFLGMVGLSAGTASGPSLYGYMKFIYG
jgi:hypothetical protein